MVAKSSRDRQDAKKDVPSESTPAAGERRAIGGYQGQYRFAAAILLPRLRDSSLEWVRLADPEAGRLDDLQVASPSRVDAYQVKWSRYASPFTFRNLTVPSSDGPSLIAQLADGWKRLRALHAPRRVVVHLITNDLPSVGDDVGHAEKGEADHFAAFLAECWYPRVTTAPAARAPVATKWNVAWEKLVTASGLTPEEFELFLDDCELEFGVQAPDTPGPNRGGTAETAREVILWREDLNALNLTLYTLVADRRQLVELTRAQLLDYLGWGERTEFRNRHEFPEPSIPYREITATAAELEEKLRSPTRGYLLLLGTPGSGKSTLLTRFMRYRMDRVIRYYAYVPDSLEPNARRGESLNFLHDITLALEQHGFRTGDTLTRPDIGLLTTRLHAQIILLGEDYRRTGRRTILVVDGLDHIVREQTPQRSLLADLPPPAQLPEGVTIVLGSQTDHLGGLPPTVQAQIREPARRIVMQRLTRAEAVAIVENAALAPKLDADAIERVVELAAGHPLALAYIVNQLRAPGDGDVGSRLDTIAPFHDRIDEQYEVHWLAVEGDFEFVRLLALLARLRGAIDMDWVATWAPPKALVELRRRFGHYFRREPDGRWHFFHNSFRAFLLERTRDLLGDGGLAESLLFHELASHCAAAPADSPWRWDELYYRSLAGEHSAVLELTQLDRLREQFFANRPAELIAEDVRRAIYSAHARNDIAAIARLVIVGAEFTDRAHYLREAPLAELLLDLGNIKAAIDSVRDGNRLRVSTVRALRAAEAFAAAGHQDEAERLLRLAEPLELLSEAGRPHGQEARDANEVLDVWVTVAARFRQVPQLLAVIDRLKRTEPDRHGGTAEDATRHLRSRLRFVLAGKLRALRRWDDAGIIVDAWDTSDDDAWGWWFWSHIRGGTDAFVQGDADRASELVDAASARAKSRNLSDDERVALAEGMLRARRDATAARDLLKDVPQPPLVGIEGSAGSDGFTPFEPRFRLNRLLGQLADTRSLSEVVPTPPDDRDEGLAFFERNVVHVARLWGMALAGRVLPGPSFVRECSPTIRLFHRVDDRAWTTWYRAMAGRDGLYRRLIYAACRHGREVVDQLREALQDAWSAPETKRFWPVETIRNLVVAFAEAGAPTAWVTARLMDLEMATGTGYDIDTRVQDATAQIRALISAGASGPAAQAYRRLLGLTHGVGYKDGQLLAWIAWAERAAAVDPESAAARFGQIAGYLPQLRDNRDVLRPVVRKLLAATSRWSTEAGVSLFRWCLKEGLVSWTTGIEIVLGTTIERHADTIDVVYAAYCQLLLPLDGNSEDEVLPSLSRQLLTRAVAAGGAKMATLALNALATTIVMVAPPVSRRALLRVLDDTAQSMGIVGVAPETRQRAEATSPPPQSSTPSTFESRDVDYFDGITTTIAELQRRASTVAGAVELAKLEKSHSSFDWRKVLPGVVASAGPGEISAISTAFAASRLDADRRWRIDLLLARRLLDLGDRAGAWRLAERAFAEAPAYGWLEYYDDGSRIECLRVLAAIDAERARTVGLDGFAADLASGRAGLREVATELHSILPALTVEIPVLEIWKPIERHLTALFEHAMPGSEPVSLAVSGVGPTVAILDLIVEYLSHPTYQLAIGAQRALLDLCAAGNEDAIKVLDRRLAAADGPHEVILTILDAISESAPKALVPFQASLRMYIRSAHFGIRMTSRRLLDRLASSGVGTSPSMTAYAEEEIQSALPAVFDFALPSGPVRRLREREAHEPLAESDDPAEIVCAFAGEIAAVAAVAGVDTAALSYRIVEIMRHLDPTVFDEATERRLRADLDSADLQLTFTRPRPLLVRRALNHAVAELLDAGRIPREVLPDVGRWLQQSDPRMLRARPGQRPDPIVRLPRGDREYLRDGWTDAVSVAPSTLLAPLQLKGQLVLAEETVLHWLAWGRPTEIRIGVRVRGWPDAALRQEDEPLNTLCEHWALVTSAEYLHRPAKSNKLVVLGDGYSLKTPGRRWLAFNPSVARSLGWSPDEQGLFRWRDINGATMVESLWWEDGCTELKPPRPYDEVGSGWLVIASPAGADALRKASGRLTAWVRVERSAHEQPTRRAYDQQLDE